MAKKQDIQGFQKQLAQSDMFALYSLRSTFFVRNIRSLRLFEAIQDVQKLAKVPSSFPWGKYEAFGIDLESWNRIEQLGIKPLLYFCHPRVITEQPRLLLYYRTLALISQKGLSGLIRGNLAGIEAGKVEQLDSEWVLKCAITLNSILSIIAKTAAEFDASQLHGFQFASAGSTIQGSWNNAVGDEGERAIRTLIVNHLRKEMLQCVLRNSKTWDYQHETHDKLIDMIDEVRIIRFKQGFHLVFSSEPDLSLRSPDDTPLIAIEIKAGADPAGALERLGAAMKSFEHDRNLNPRVKTVYVVRSMTVELQRRISQSNPFDHTFALGDLLINEKSQKVFVNLLLRTMLDHRKAK